MGKRFKLIKKDQYYRDIKYKLLTDKTLFQYEEKKHIVVHALIPKSLLSVLLLLGNEKCSELNFRINIMRKDVGESVALVLFYIYSHEYEKLEEIDLIVRNKIDRIMKLLD